MTTNQITIFQCKCADRKQHRLTLDGGPTGHYQLELCESCYQNADKRFVIKEEQIVDSEIKKSEGPCEQHPSSFTPLQEVIGID
jgi:hypothetical protein